jgi:hypothetical protein
MYFRGIDHPDREPTRNRFSTEDRKSKFTEKVAKTVVDGDLYFSMRSNAAERFYVPVEPGEHGIAEDSEGTLLCVTHRFRKQFDDLPGKWEAYDGGGNLVIKVNKAADGDIVFEAMRAVESALYHTPLGRAVGRDALRNMAESLCKSFGIDREDAFESYGKAKSRFQVNTDQEVAAKDALRELLTFAPESGYDERLGEIGADADGVGFAENAEQYAMVINGQSDGFGGKARKYGEALPFLSQPVFYAVLGYKGNGRAFQSRIDALMEAVGLDEDDLR